MVLKVQSVDSSLARWIRINQYSLVTAQIPNFSVPSSLSFFCSDGLGWCLEIKVLQQTGMGNIVQEGSEEVSEERMLWIAGLSVWKLPLQVP